METRKQKRKAKSTSPTSPSNSATPAIQQPDNAYLVNGMVPNEVLAYMSSYVPEPRDQALAAQACMQLYSIFQQPRDESAYKKLAQGVIDDDRAP
jgi:hypothetical protein